jgi:hypothetical protein
MAAAFFFFAARANIPDIKTPDKIVYGFNSMHTHHSAAAVRTDYGFTFLLSSAHFSPLFKLIIQQPLQ